jgi:hypothetical protein
MNNRSKPLRVAWLTTLAVFLLTVGSGQSAPVPSSIPAEHTHARDLLDNAMRYVSPENKIVDPVSGYPFEGWNADPSKGLYLRSFTQLTAIGQWMELMANVASGQAETPHLSREQALVQLANLVKTLRQDQADPTLASKGLLGNFLDLATGKRLGPLSSNIEKSKLFDSFGTTRGEAIWKALIEAGWISPRLDGHEADITRGVKYGFEHFEGPLAPFGDEATRQKLMKLLDARVVMLIFGDNSNLSSSAAKTIGALLVPPLKDNPRAVAIRGELEQFLEIQKPGYARLYDASTGLFFFGYDATRDRLFGWDDLQGKRVIGHMDYMVNEFRGPATFIAARFELPVDAIKNLGFKIKPYSMKDGQPLDTLAPWEGSAFQAMGLSLSLGEMNRPSWQSLLKNVVAIEIDFASKKGLPGFLSESYTGDGSQYTGSVGIPEITVSPRPRITDAASLYTLGVAYSIAPNEVEAFLKANWPAISGLFTEHGPWEGFNIDRHEPIRFQTTAHTLALILGLIGQGSANMERYLESKKLTARLDRFFKVGPGVDLLATIPAFAWTAKDSQVASFKERSEFHVKGEKLPFFGVAFVAQSPQGLDLSGGLLTLRYRSTSTVDAVTIELKPVKLLTDNSILIPRVITARLEATGAAEHEIVVPLPATPGLSQIKEVVIYHEGPKADTIDVTVTHFAVTPIGPK